MQKQRSSQPAAAAARSPPAAAALRSSAASSLAFTYAAKLKAGAQVGNALGANTVRCMMAGGMLTCCCHPSIAAYTRSWKRHAHCF